MKKWTCLVSHLLGVLLVISTTSPMDAAISAPAYEASFTLWRRASTYDASELSDRSRKKDVAKQPGDAGLVRSNSNWLRYDFQIDNAGWYELYLAGSPLTWTRDIHLDAMRIHKGHLKEQDRLASYKAICKVRNIYLTRGKHSLKIIMDAFPGLYLQGWGLRRSQTVATKLHAVSQGNTIGRVTDTRTLKIEYGPLKKETKLDLIGLEDISKKSFKLATLMLEAVSQNITQKISFQLPQQGSYTIIPKLDDKFALPADLGLPRLGAIDTTPVVSQKAEVKKTLLWEIDCVKQTRNGLPVTLNETFWEAHGKTRLHHSDAGTYRESSDNLGDNPIVTSWGGRSLSSFSYAIDVPQAQVPYLLEVDYPDDNRRTTNVIILEKATTWPRHQYSQAQLGSGYETGDAFELSNQMQTHRVYFWPSVKTIRAALVTMHPGMRAAAARIRLYRLPEGLPNPTNVHTNKLADTKETSGGGRGFASYFEEWGRWGAHVRSSFLTDLNPMSRDIVGIDRWLQLSRAVGMNAIRPTEVVYRSCTYNSDELAGYGRRPYDAPRLAVLLAEKYQMRYSPEIHVTPLKTLDNLVKAKAENPEDTLLYSRTGFVGAKNDSGPGFNPLHPAVQQRYIDIVGELADKLGDSPAFEGVNCRLMTWAGNSWTWLCSLNWGYGDWTINAFEQDTGIKISNQSKVLENKKSPQRFHERYEFLTSPNMKHRWIAWRNARMFDYFKRLRDRIRQANSNAKLIFTGSYELDAVFEHAPGILPRMLLRDAGFDMDAMGKESGFEFFVSSGYGRAKTTSPVEDQEKLDQLLRNEKQLTSGDAGKSYLFGNTYFEVHKRVPVDKLGLPDLKPRSYCGAAEAAGRMSLQKLAVVLAEQDSLNMAQGGLGYIWGQPEFYVPWLAEFTALPRVSFHAVKFSGDAVVVRQKKIDEKIYFYAVNREPFPVDVTISLDAQSVIRLGTGQSLPLSAGTLSLKLKPFELASFRCDSNRLLKQVTVRVPQARMTLLKNRLSQCQQWLVALQDGERKGSLDASRMNSFANLLEQSWQAFGEQKYWLTRILLGSKPMLEVYEALGQYPKNQLGRNFPLQLIVRPTSKYVPANPPMFDAMTLAKTAQSVSSLSVVDSATLNPDWSGSEVLFAKERLRLQFPIKMAGMYRIALGHVRSSPGALMASINEQSLPNLAKTHKPNTPEQTVFGTHALKPGISTLNLQGTGEMGVYALNVEPVYHALKSDVWQSLGPFPSAWYSTWQANAKTAIHDAMVRIDPPMNPLNVSATYENAFGLRSKWTTTDHAYSKYQKWGVNFLSRVGITEGYICYAVTFITAPEDREARIFIGCDWWANAYLNGEKIISERDEAAKKDGAQFNGWKPIPATIKLKKGVNTLLVKLHGGSAASWFTAFLTDPGDLSITAKKP